ncbi:MAG: ASCH domain-containing protein [Bryobacterales bacterium]|nr:ASCH domain-containing protein [Bryobacterales bacterium]
MSTATQADLTNARVLTIRHPWAWAILHAGKNIENRSWCTHHRGPLLIASASTISKSYYENEAAYLASEYRVKCPPREGLVAAAIVGMVELVD